MTDTIRIVIDLKTAGSMTQRLKPLMKQLNAAVQDGVSHEEIVTQLAANGLDVPLNTFRSYLYRYRKELSKRAENAASSAKK